MNISSWIARFHFADSRELLGGSLLRRESRAYNAIFLWFREQCYRQDAILKRIGKLYLAGQRPQTSTIVGRRRCRRSILLLQLNSACSLPSVKSRPISKWTSFPDCCNDTCRGRSSAITNTSFHCQECFFWISSVKNRRFATLEIIRFRGSTRLCKPFDLWISIYRGIPRIPQLIS